MIGDRDVAAAMWIRACTTAMAGAAAELTSNITLIGGGELWEEG
jgi:hypothetical protein